MSVFSSCLHLDHSFGHSESQHGPIEWIQLGVAQKYQKTRILALFDHVCHRMSVFWLNDTFSHYDAYNRPKNLI